MSFFIPLFSGKLNFVISCRIKGLSLNLRWSDALTTQDYSHVNVTTPFGPRKISGTWEFGSYGLTFLAHFFIDIETNTGISNFVKLLVQR